MVRRAVKSAGILIYKVNSDYLGSGFCFVKGLRKDRHFLITGSFADLAAHPRVLSLARSLTFVAAGRQRSPRVQYVGICANLPTV